MTSHKFLISHPWKITSTIHNQGQPSPTTSTQHGPGWINKNESLVSISKKLIWHGLFKFVLVVHNQISRQGSSYALAVSVILILTRLQPKLTQSFPWVKPEICCAKEIYWADTDCDAFSCFQLNCVEHILLLTIAESWIIVVANKGDLQNIQQINCCKSLVCNFTAPQSGSMFFYSDLTRSYHWSLYSLYCKKNTDPVVWPGLTRIK